MIQNSIKSVPMTMTTCDPVTHLELHGLRTHYALKQEIPRTLCEGLFCRLP